MIQTCSGKATVGILLLVLAIAADGYSQTSAIQSKSLVVAIFKDASFPTYLGVDPDALKARFDHSGISCEFLNFEQVCDPKILTLDNYKILINPYGDSFPVAAVEAIMTFRAAGGVFVNPGIPLVHPVAKKDGAWQTSDSAMEYLPRFNIGRFADGPEGNIRPTKIMNEIGLQNIPWDRIKTGVLGQQGLSYESITNVQSYEPVLEYANMGHTVILYQNNGGVDIWAGTTGLSYDGVKWVRDKDLMNLHCELIKRLSLYALMKKGTLPAQRFNPIASEKFELQENEPFTPIFRKNRTEIYPKSKPAAQHLVLFRNPALNNDEYILLRSLQGLANRDRNPELFIQGELAHNDDMFWLRYLKEEGYIKDYSEVNSLDDLLQRYGYKDAVLVDNQLYCSLNIATMIAGMENVLIVTNPEIARKYGLNIKIDLRGKWKTTIDAYRDVYAQYKDRFNKQVVTFQRPCDGPSSAVRDYLIAHRIFIVWVTGSLDGACPGSNPAEEKEFFTDILARDFPVNIPALGFPYDGENIGIGEVGGVSLLSACGKYHVANNLGSNLTLYSAFPARKILKQPEQADIALDRSKVYLSLVVSDGDNLLTWMYLFNKWQNEFQKERDYSLSWTMAPTLCELMPFMAERAVTMLNKRDSIGAGVSGVGYIYMQQYGKLFGNARAAVLNDYIDLTQQCMKKNDQRWVHIMGYGGHGSPWLSNYSQINGIKAVICGYGNGESPTNPAMLTETVNDIPVFHCAIIGHPNNDEFVSNLRNLCNRLPRPAFLNVFLTNWEFKPDTMDALAKRLANEGYLLVTPDRLGDLYKQAKSSPPQSGSARVVNK